VSSIYLINPGSDFPTYFGAEVYGGWGLAPAQSMADLCTATVAAMIPEDFDVTLGDEHVGPIDYDHSAAIIAITGKVSQWRRMKEIAQEFRGRGKLVVIGGPFASLCPEKVAPHADVLVTGEIEDIATELFDDLRASRARPRYHGTRPSLESSPVPRWDLYPHERALMGTVQTSRGCPFDCEFCDVIAYLGRKQRHKPIEGVVAELDELYRYGYRLVFLADDNLTVHRRRAKELLVAIRDWNDRQVEGRVTFISQVSIDAAKDDEILQLCSEAGLVNVFIGIETPNVESLLETGKKQNVGIDLTEEIARFLDYGIIVAGGMIVGFDNDGPDIFQRQYDFAMQARLPVVSLGALVAPAATPLHKRMQEAGRLVDETAEAEVAAMPWSTNIIPKQMTREELFSGIRDLARNLYSPSRFAERIEMTVDRLGVRRDAAKLQEQGVGPGRPVDQDHQQLIGLLAARGPDYADMVTRVVAAAERRPDAAVILYACLATYSQICYMYDQADFFGGDSIKKPA